MGGNRRTFDDWLKELQNIVHEVIEPTLSLDQLPEFDRSDARAYFRDGSSPSLYFKECLEDHIGHGDTLQEVLKPMNIEELKKQLLEKVAGLAKK